jgi:hypothetical protein
VSRKSKRSTDEGRYSWLDVIIWLWHAWALTWRVELRKDTQELIGRDWQVDLRRRGLWRVYDRTKLSYVVPQELEVVGWCKSSADWHTSLVLRQPIGMAQPREFPCVPR